MDPIASATAELGENGWKNLKIDADNAINKTMLRDRETHLLNIYTAQFTKAWEIIRQKKASQATIAKLPMPEEVAQEDLPVRARRSSSGWQSDIIAFDSYLGELMDKAKVPEKQSLESRITLVPGEQETNSEVVPVTDGAGGYIDFAPAEDTVQFQVNSALKGQAVKWEFELAHDAIRSFKGAVQLTPKTSDKTNANPLIAAIIIET
ncbi:hypothetical protein SH501x_001114 [Pirellulaceae bacterium SH501]